MTDPTTDPNADPTADPSVPDAGGERSTSPATELDLTPATPAPVGPNRRWRNWAIMGTFGLVAGFVLFQALTSARVYFLNVDEAVAQRASLGDETFRMQGTVVDETRSGTDGALVFTLSFGGEDAEVRHVGAEPSDLFEIGQAVVAEGRWDGNQFVSSQVLVKHSEEYIEDNPDRVGYDLDDTETDTDTDAP